MSFNIPKIPAKRVVVVGGGFGGLRLCRTLAKNPDFQVVLIDQNNFHQFPPLIYQIATAGLQVSSIAFPFRKMFDDCKNVYFRMCELRAVYPKERYIQTSIGKLDYDYLVIATGTTTNYFGNQRVQDESMPMKTISESMGLRNALLETFERANTCASAEERAELLNVVIVGGGPTGVEIAGALAEMREHVLPRDYPDLDTSLLKIHLVQGGKRLLPAMSETASAASLKYLTQMGVDVQLNAFVVDYDDHTVKLQDGRSFKSQTIIWVCGVTGRRIEGIDSASYGRGNRLLVDEYNKVEGYNNIFAIGDIALMKCRGYPNGHPQMAQAAIQQGKNLGENFIRKEKGESQKRFRYRDLGSMATIGRNKAVADIAGFNLTGMFAWFLWMGVHLMSILGVKNKLSVVLDWAWSYITYDKSNRTIITAKLPRVISERNFQISRRHWGELSREQEAEAARIAAETDKANNAAEHAKIALARTALDRADSALRSLQAAQQRLGGSPAPAAATAPAVEPAAPAAPAAAAPAAPAVKTVQAEPAEPAEAPVAAPAAKPKSEAKPAAKAEAKAEAEKPAKKPATRVRRVNKNAPARSKTVEAK